MAKQREKGVALLLRRNGRSIGEIARELKVSKSTVSGWCRDIILTKKQQGHIAYRSKHHATAALLRAAEQRRKRRLQETEHAVLLGHTDIGNLSKRDIQMVGLGLYWGEGYKRGNQELGFTNSDPDMIRFYINWLQMQFHIDTQNLVLRVSINNIHAKRIRDVERQWSKSTGIPLHQFTRPSLIKTVVQKEYINKTAHLGTLRVKVRKGTFLRRRILGAISVLQNIK